MWPKTIPARDRRYLERRAQMIAQGRTTGLTGANRRCDAAALARAAAKLLKTLRAFEGHYPTHAMDEGMKIAARAVMDQFPFAADEDERRLFEAGLSAQEAQWALMGVEAHATAIAAQAGKDDPSRGHWPRWLVREAGAVFRRLGLPVGRSGDFQVVVAAVFEIAGFRSRKNPAEPLDPDNYIKEYLAKVKTPEN